MEGRRPPEGFMKKIVDKGGKFIRGVVAAGAIAGAEQSAQADDHLAMTRAQEHHKTAYTPDAPAKAAETTKSKPHAKKKEVAKLPQIIENPTADMPAGDPLGPTGRNPLAEKASAAVAQYEKSGSTIPYKIPAMRRKDEGALADVSVMAGLESAKFTRTGPAADDVVYSKDGLSVEGAKDEDAFNEISSLFDEHCTNPNQEPPEWVIRKIKEDMAKLSVHRLPEIKGRYNPLNYAPFTDVKRPW